MSMAQYQELKGESFAASRAQSVAPTQAFRQQQVLQENGWHFSATPTCAPWRGPRSVAASPWGTDASGPRFSDGLLSYLQPPSIPPRAFGQTSLRQVARES